MSHQPVLVVTDNLFDATSALRFEVNVGKAMFVDHDGNIVILAREMIDTDSVTRILNYAEIKSTYRPYDCKMDGNRPSVIISDHDIEDVIREFRAWVTIKVDDRRK